MAPSDHDRQLLAAARKRGWLTDATLGRIQQQVTEGPDAALGELLVGGEWLTPRQLATLEADVSGVSRAHDEEDEGPQGKRSLLTVKSVFYLIVLLVVLAGLIGYPVWVGMKTGASRALCQSNLKTIGQSMVLYRDSEMGRGTLYPEETGDQFLVHLYRTGITKDATVFICPATSDDNKGGKRLEQEAIRANACSYAGRRNATQGEYPGLFSMSGSAETSMACDDLQGKPRFNHGDVVMVLFADGHVEEIASDDKRIAEEGFDAGGLLDPLAD